MEERRLNVFNLFSIALVALTGFVILGYLIILINPHVFFNPFQPDRVVDATPTPTSGPLLQPTYTPTETGTPTLTPSPRPTRTPTQIPTATPTWPPTPTSTPQFTRSPYPFSCEVTYQQNPYGIPWSGVAGHIEDMDGNPLPGYRVQVGCPGVPYALNAVAGENQRYNLIYENEAGWEVSCDPSGYRQMDVAVQLYQDQLDETSVAVSDVVIAELGDWINRSLGYVVCTLNWEDFQ